ncbi:hypothetical protein H6G96_31315 [Nostoc sp. FACHB-892]|uniref:hypothetical protein n=1 Tax=Nostoc sp. FACHB-892 TaxID=2692843 RepID=UPI0016889A35|nr:hypothetical protein [Nostoc sp. FACHB-892]MBD2730690.1 hypothetical protein [Nostoc sp. FACHB-892]
MLPLTRTIFKIIANGRESVLRIEAVAGSVFGITAGVLSGAVAAGVGGGVRLKVEFDMMQTK